MGDWKKRFLETIFRLQKQHKRITGLVICPQANNMMMAAGDLSTTDDNGYVSIIVIGDSMVDVRVNLGQREPVIIIEYITQENIPESVAVHRDSV